MESDRLSSLQNFVANTERSSAAIAKPQVLNPSPREHFCQYLRQTPQHLELFQLSGIS